MKAKSFPQQVQSDSPPPDIVTSRCVTPNFPRAHARKYEGGKIPVGGKVVVFVRHGEGYHNVGGVEKKYNR
eukprot:662090-Amorphochlora_amoeboformis.AAC.1